MDVEDILSKFSNSNCDRMVGKPKIFIFPFCRWLQSYFPKKKQTSIEISLFKYFSGVSYLIQVFWGVEKSKAITSVPLNWKKMKQLTCQRIRISKYAMPPCRASDHSVIQKTVRGIYKLCATSGHSMRTTHIWTIYWKWLEMRPAWCAPKNLDCKRAATRIGDSSKHFISIQAIMSIRIEILCAFFYIIYIFFAAFYHVNHTCLYIYFFLLIFEFIL